MPKAIITIECEDGSNTLNIRSDFDPPITADTDLENAPASHIAALIALDAMRSGGELIESDTQTEEHDARLES